VKARISDLADLVKFVEASGFEDERLDTKERRFWWIDEVNAKMSSFQWFGTSTKVKSFLTFLFLETA
jgi:hypothetical protein